MREGRRGRRRKVGKWKNIYIYIYLNKTIKTESWKGIGAHYIL